MVAHTFDEVEAHLVVRVKEDRRLERIRASLERVPDCVQERLNLLGAHLSVIRYRAPKEHDRRAEINSDLLAKGWQHLLWPVARIEGMTYPTQAEAFVRRGPRGPVARNRFLSRFVRPAFRSEETALHEYGHLVSFALGLSSLAEFYAVWARHSPNAVEELFLRGNEERKQQEWFAKLFERFYRSEQSRERLPPRLLGYMSALEADVHNGRYDDRLLELSRRTSQNRYLESARELGALLLPREVYRQLRQRGAWGLEFYGQRWYAIQSEAKRLELGSVTELLNEQRARLVAEGAFSAMEQIELNEVCGDISETSICRAVHRYRAREELWHPCRGRRSQGCVVSYGPTLKALDEWSEQRRLSYAWLPTERHERIARGASARAAEPTPTPRVKIRVAWASP